MGILVIQNGFADFQRARFDNEISKYALELEVAFQEVVAKKLGKFREGQQYVMPKYNDLSKVK